MSKPNENSILDIGRQDKGSRLDSPDDFSYFDLESNNSKDINLNSKNFGDFNLLAGQENGEIKNDFNPNQDECGPQHSSNCDISRNISTQILCSSTPKPEYAGLRCKTFTLVSLNPDDDSVPEVDGNNQAFLVAKSLRMPSLTEKEIGKKFHDLSFAFKTDSMTVQNRLQLMKRRRDQAETNIENELKRMKSKLKNLQFLDVSAERANLMTDLKKQLDFLQNATVHLSSSAEGYGYVQHEERLLELVSVMLQHVENLEATLREKLKLEEKRSQAVTLDAEVDGDRLLRRRSVVTVAAEGSSRRRASIAALPRLGFSLLESGNGKGTQVVPSCRTAGGTSKKLALSYSESSRALNDSLSGDESRRDSAGNRHRTDSRTSESSMKNIEEFPEHRSTDSAESANSENQDVEAEEAREVMDSSLRRLYESLDDISLNSGAQNSVSLVHCLRKIVEWNIVIMSATRFRWPDHVLQYVPFLITWYVVFVLSLIFFSGLFTGISGCFTYSLHYSCAWLFVLTLLILARRFYRFLLLLVLFFVCVFLLAFFLLTKVVLPILTNEEIGEFFRSFGVVFEVRYLNGPPPI